MGTATSRAYPLLHRVLRAPHTAAAPSAEIRTANGVEDPSFLYSLQKHHVFALRLLLNIDFKTQIGSFGLSTAVRTAQPAHALAEGFRGEALTKQLLGQNSLVQSCENPICSVTSVYIFMHFQIS